MLIQSYYYYVYISDRTHVFLQPKRNDDKYADSITISSANMLNLVNTAEEKKFDRGKKKVKKRNGMKSLKFGKYKKLKDKVYL